MPLRPDLLTKRWSTVELPILPFLAPRVFTPWPSRGRRAHTGAQPVRESDTNEDSYDIPPQKSGEEEEGRVRRGFLLRRHAPKDTRTSKLPSTKGADGGRGTSDNRWGELLSSYGTRTDSAEESTEHTFTRSFRDEFHGKYEEIWETGLMKVPDGMEIQTEGRNVSEEDSAGETSHRFRATGRVRLIRSGTRKVGKDVSKEDSAGQESHRFRRIVRVKLVQSEKRVVGQAKSVAPGFGAIYFRKSRAGLLRRTAEYLPLQQRTRRRAGTARVRLIRSEKRVVGQAKSIALGEGAIFFRKNREGLLRQNTEKILLGQIAGTARVRLVRSEKRVVGQAKSVAPGEGAIFFRKNKEGLLRQSTEQILLRQIAGTATNRRPGSRKLPYHAKHVRCMPNEAGSLDEMKSWKVRFAEFNGALDAVLDGDHPLQPRNKEKKTLGAFRRRLIQRESSRVLRKMREVLPTKEEINEGRHSTKPLESLATIYKDPYPPGYAFGDTLDYITKYCLHHPTSRSSKDALEIFEIFEHMLRSEPSTHFHLNQRSIYLLLENLDNASAEILFQVLTKYHNPIHRSTLMHFPSKLRLSGGTDERMEVLKRLRQEGSDFNSPEVMSVCATLLQLKNRTSKVTFSDSEIFGFMLECGMMPNIIIYNVLLQNSLEGGDPETGWQIYDMMAQNGIETDAYTYSLLLSDAKLRNDRRAIGRILNIVAEKGIRNVHIVTDLLHTIFLFRRNPDNSLQGAQTVEPSKPSERMLLVYRQHFQLEPLQRLFPWLEHSSSNTAPDSNDELMDPSGATLVVMLTALLHELSEPTLAVLFYTHFCDLLKAGDPIARSLSQSTHIFNVILSVLGKFQRTLALCPRLIGDMLSANIATTEDTETTLDTDTGDSETSQQVDGNVHDNSESDHSPVQDLALSETSPGINNTQRHLEASAAGPMSANHSSTGGRRLYPKPDVYTWSILLKVFMDHGQPRAAEKVLVMMEERGVQPNEVTWTSLISGYARMQDMSMTVDAVNRLQAAGLSLDGFTMKALAYFQNRRALIEAMKASEESGTRQPLKKGPVALGTARKALNGTLKTVGDGIEVDVSKTATGATD